MFLIASRGTRRVRGQPLWAQVVHFARSCKPDTQIPHCQSMLAIKMCKMWKNKSSTRDAPKQEWSYKLSAIYLRQTVQFFYFDLMFCGWLKVSLKFNRKKPSGLRVPKRLLLLAKLTSHKASKSLVRQSRFIPAGNAHLRQTTKAFP